MSEFLFNNVLDLQSATLLKRDSGAGVFLWPLLDFFSTPPGNYFYLYSFLSVANKSTLRIHIGKLVLSLYITYIFLHSPSQSSKIYLYYFSLVEITFVKNWFRSLPHNTPS